VVLISGAKTFPPHQRAYYSAGDVKRHNAATHGAAGMISINTPTDEARNPFEKRARQRGIVPMTYLDPSGNPVDTVESLRGSASLNGGTAAKLFNGATIPLDRLLADAENGVAHSFPLSATASMKTVTHLAQVRSEDIIGVLPGSGAKLTRDWLRTIYHSPKDDLSQTFDFASGARYAETNLRLVRAIADAPSRPSWIPGDFFGEKFGRGGRKATITLR